MNEDRMIEYENALRQSENQAMKNRLENYQNDLTNQKEDKSMIQQQLDLGEELDRIDYLLRGYTLERDDKTGESKWVRPNDNDMIILSEYGVHLIRNTIAWYLNKNTLLSNYDEETIFAKMEDFSNDLNDTIFMEYEKVFQYPTLLDCQSILDKRAKSKSDIKIYAMQIMGKKLSEFEKEKIHKKIMEEVEPIVERELQKIKEQIIKNKLKRFMIIIREIQDAVHSTYLRAWKGQERLTLRQHIHISETKGGMPYPQNNTGGMFSWLKKN